MFYLTIRVFFSRLLKACADSNDMKLYILKDSGIEGSNNSGRLISTLIEDCQLVRLRERAEKVEGFFSFDADGEAVFDSTRLSKTVNVSSLFRYVLDVYKFYKFFRCVKYHCVILNNMLMVNVLIAGLLAGKEVYVFSRENHMPKIMLKFYSILKNHFSFTIISNNRVFIRNWPGLYACYVPNVIEDEFFFGRKNWIGGQLKFVLAGAVYPLKNQYILIKLALYLRSLNPEVDFRIDVFGRIINEEYFSSICTSLREYGLQKIIVFHGEIKKKELKSRFLEADIFVQTSTSEGQSRALIEAVQMGLVPLVTSAGEPKKLYDSECMVDLDSCDATFNLEKLLQILGSREECLNRLQSSLKNCCSRAVVKKKLVKILGG